MSAPTPVVRQYTLVRDTSRCALCGALSPLEWNHRAAVGMGGSKHRPGVAEGVILCNRCNTDIESDADLMKTALANGIKIRKWADPNRVPIYYQQEWRWYRLEGIERVEVTAMVALDMMHAVYGDAYFHWRND